MFLLHRPTPRDIERFIEASRALPLSYGPAGLAAERAAGFQIDDHSSIVGHGAEAFARARTALEQWKHFGLGWVELFPKGAPIVPGTVVAVLVRHLGFYSLSGCRVVYTVEDDGTFGFAYGTLANHVECGEELFKVRLNPDTGAVSYTIRAASRPRALLARLGYPVTRALQARFRRDSAAAMARAVAG